MPSLCQRCSQSHHIRLEILNRAVLSGLEADLDKYLSGSESDSGKSMTALKSHISHRIITVRSAHKPTGSRSQSVVFSHLLNQEYRRQDRIQAAYEAGIDTLEEYRKKKGSLHKTDTETEIRNSKTGSCRLPASGTRPVLTGRYPCTAETGCYDPMCKKRTAESFSFPYYLLSLRKHDTNSLS